MGNEVFLNDLGIFHLLIEVAGQQQHGIFQLALAAVERALAKVVRHDGRTDHDRRDQQYAAKDESTDRTAANWR